MVARFYYFPIRGNKLILEDNGINGKPIYIIYPRLTTRKINYELLAVMKCLFLFKDNEEHLNACDSLTQIYETHDGEIVNVYFTINVNDKQLCIEEQEADISIESLSCLDIDDETCKIICIELERMCNNYGVS